ncbi:MAG TPA: Gfo/Idh/MocA family oxidoreductase, partial [Bacteroidia bacterium]|nr:Gfo/Idh/MocA family oxidoreductase [Bacteroidia bacterium]
MRVKAGVVGVGAIGRNHARVYAELESVDLVAIYDANLDHARALAAEFGTEAVGSLDELIARVDAASVATPTVTHREIATRLLGAGRHVLVEKPIADSVDDAKAMIDLAAEKGCVLQVGHIERFNPVMSRLEEVLDSPRFIECHRLSPFPQ